VATSLVKTGPKQYPCASCRQKELEGDALIRIGDAVKSKLRNLGLKL
jgi:hypothetical protein